MLKNTGMSEKFRIFRQFYNVNIDVHSVSFKVKSSILLVQQ